MMCLSLPLHCASAQGAFNSQCYIYFEWHWITQGGGVWILQFYKKLVWDEEKFKKLVLYLRIAKKLLKPNKRISWENCH